MASLVSAVSKTVFNKESKRLFWKQTDLLFRNCVPLKEGGVERGRIEEGLKSKDWIVWDFQGTFGRKERYLRDQKLDLGKIYARNGQIHIFSFLFFKLLSFCGHFIHIIYWLFFPKKQVAMHMHNKHMAEKRKEDILMIWHMLSK